MIPSRDDPQVRGFIHKKDCIYNSNCSCTIEEKTSLLKTKMCKYINILYPKKYNFTNKKQKHNLNDILDDILYIMDTGVPYRKLRSKINHNSLYYHVDFFIKSNVFEKFYNYLLYEYFETNKEEKLKYQSIDTSFIINKGAYQSEVKRNIYAKGKNCLKLSLIVSSFGIPISVVVDTGNVHDCKIFEKNMKEMLYDSNDQKGEKYFLADAGYDSKKIRSVMSEKGYIVKIPKNRRGAKEKIKVDKSDNIYKKRMIVENVFATIKQSRRLSNIYEKFVMSYRMYLFLMLCKIVISKQK